MRNHYLCSVFIDKGAAKDSEKGRELQILAIKEYERNGNKGVADAECETQGGDGLDNGRCELQLYRGGRHRVHGSGNVCGELDEAADELLRMQREAEVYRNSLRVRRLKDNSVKRPTGGLG